MPTTFIAGLAVNLPSRFKEGYVLDADDAELLNQIWLKRVVSRVRRLLALGQLDAQSIDAKVSEFHAEDLTPYSVATDAAEDDPVLLEAFDMAKELISQRMAKDNVPPPKNLDIHAAALVEGIPALVEQARMRIEMRHQAAAALLSQIGTKSVGDA